MAFAAASLGFFVVLLLPVGHARRLLTYKAPEPASADAHAADNISAQLANLAMQAGNKVEEISAEAGTSAAANLNRDLPESLAKQHFINLVKKTVLMFPSCTQKLKEASLKWVSSSDGLEPLNFVELYSLAKDTAKDTGVGDLFDPLHMDAMNTGIARWGQDPDVEGLLKTFSEGNAKVVSVDKLAELYECMTAQVENVTAWYCALPHGNTYDIKIVSCALQILLNAEVQNKFGMEWQDIAPSVIAQQGQITDGSRFADAYSLFHQSMANFFDAARPGDESGYARELRANESDYAREMHAIMGRPQTHRRLKHILRRMHWAKV